MSLLLTLLKKDLIRARRNPWVILINLALPVLITTLIAVAFGGSSSGKGIGTIKLAIIDEDNTPLSNFLRGAFEQGEAREFIDAQVMSRDEAMKQIKDDQISAAVILPKDFAVDFLEGRSELTIELIKNPAQQYYPAIVEELLGVLVEGMNAISVNFGDDLSMWVGVFKDDELPDFLKMSQIYLDLDKRSKALKDYLSPPLIIYGEETIVSADAEEKEERNSMANVFAFMLPGMASMFLLFIADGSMRDIFKETKFRTFDRYRTMHHKLLTFIASKVISALILICLSGFILFFGSTLIFQFSWGDPLAISALVFAYAICAAGLLALCAAISRSEKRANGINITVIIGMSFMGGAYFPAKNLQPFISENISPLLPNYWLIETVRAVHFEPGTAWVLPVVKLAVVGLVLMVAAAALFRVQLTKGVRE